MRSRGCHDLLSTDGGSALTSLETLKLGKALALCTDPDSSRSGRTRDVVALRVPPVSGPGRTGIGGGCNGRVGKVLARG